MSTRMFSEDQLEQLRSCPDIGRDDLIRYFTVPPTDVAFIDPGRGRGRGRVTASAPGRTLRWHQIARPCSLMPRAESCGHGSTPSHNDRASHELTRSRGRTVWRNRSGEASGYPGIYEREQTVKKPKKVAMVFISSLALLCGALTSPAQANYGEVHRFRAQYGNSVLQGKMSWSESGRTVTIVGTQTIATGANACFQAFFVPHPGNEDWWNKGRTGEFCSAGVWPFETRALHDAPGGVSKVKILWGKEPSDALWIVQGWCYPINGCEWGH